MRTTGRYEQYGSLQHFIPDPLPPKNPILELDVDVAHLYGQAMLKIGQLNEIINRVPDIKRFIKAYVIKEALRSSEIEGIHTTLADVFTHSITGSKPSKDTQLVMNYTKALDKALELIRDQGLPISSRVIRGAHEALMSIGEGDKADPGNYRKQSVRVGKLIPAPAHEVPQLMTDLEKFINEDDSFSPLIKAGLAHVQFETIHPFLDGNGRIGRLLIVLMLLQENLLSAPILYPSYYFKEFQMEYYYRLDEVRTLGNFEGWIAFYLRVICMSSQDAYLRINDIEKLKKELLVLISHAASSPKTYETQERSLSILFEYPIIDVNELSAQLDMSYNTARDIIDDFLKLEIVVEESQQKRGKLFRFKKYFEVLEKEYHITMPF